ncbi:hypothetical protein M514_05907 [Trichuris suis]|uniref:Uncharacterized protein n=1 Tax=Trichuris suis TaxID=68888 RepID=A0A085MU92_9BILA|nr:hypothetical protein M513_05907 [Trichuris suis]KFD60788.1 hypothetical protein M514_05907 [Trichuris suis]
MHEDALEKWMNEGDSATAAHHYNYSEIVQVVVVSIEKADSGEEVNHKDGENLAERILTNRLIQLTSESLKGLNAAL